MINVKFDYDNSLVLELHFNVFIILNKSHPKCN